MERSTFLWKYTCFVFIVLLVFLGNIGFASNGSGASPNVAISGDRISIRAMGVPLGELLEAIERETGIQFEVEEGILEEIVFVDLTNLPFSEGIKKILPSHNHAILYGPSGKIRKVVFIGKGKASGMATVNRGGSDAERDRSDGRANDRIVQSGAPPQGERGKKQAPSSSTKPAIEGPPGADSVKHQPPPGSQVPVITGPPTEDVIKRNPPPGADPKVISGPPTEDNVKQNPPPGSDITVKEGPPEGDPSPPRIPSDSGPTGGESPPPSQKGG